MSNSADLDLKQSKEAALKFLARREHSKKELRQKLQKKGFSVDVITAVLHELAHKDWQSDERFTECYIRARVSAGFGSVRIAFELSQRGVQNRIIEKNLKRMDNQFWMNQIRGVCSKRFKQVADDQHRQVKRYRFLQGRGFARDRIIQFLKGNDNEYQ